MVQSPYEQLARDAAARFGVDPNVFVRQINQESGFNPNARSGSGAVGIAQFMPATARGMGVNPLDPRSALEGAARYDSNLLHQFGGNYRLALAGYNAGGGNAQHALAAYPETRNYVASILGGHAPSSRVPSAQFEQITRPSQLPSLPMVDSRRLSAVNLLFSDDPVMASLLTNHLYNQGVGTGSPLQAPQTALHEANIGAKPVLGSGYHAIEAFGRNFGLIPGSTTGGQHAPGSYHYTGHAVDFGNANNSPTKLAATMQYLTAHPQGVLEAFYDPSHTWIKNGVVHQGIFGGHSDHLHLAA